MRHTLGQAHNFLKTWSQQYEMWRHCTNNFLFISSFSFLLAGIVHLCALLRLTNMEILFDKQIRTFIAPWYTAAHTCPRWQTGVFGDVYISIHLCASCTLGHFMGGHHLLFLRFFKMICSTQHFHALPLADKHSNFIVCTILCICPRWQVEKFLWGFHFANIWCRYKIKVVLQILKCTKLRNQKIYNSEQSGSF